MAKSPENKSGGVVSISVITTLMLTGDRGCSLDTGAAFVLGGGTAPRKSSRHGEARKGHQIIPPQDRQPAPNGSILSVAAGKLEVRSGAVCTA